MSLAPRSWRFTCQCFPFGVLAAVLEVDDRPTALLMLLMCSCFFPWPYPPCVSSTFGCATSGGLCSQLSSVVMLSTDGRCGQLARARWRVSPPFRLQINVSKTLKGRTRFEAVEGAERLWDLSPTGTYFVSQVWWVQDRLGSPRQRMRSESWRAQACPTAKSPGAGPGGAAGLVTWPLDEHFMSCADEHAMSCADENAMSCANEHAMSQQRAWHQLACLWGHMN